MLTKKLKKAWIKALTSGKYIQGIGKLKNNGKYCCLGVLCKVAGIGISKDGETVAKKDGKSYDPIDKLLPKGESEKLWNMNDSQRKSFTEIAEYIDKNL